MSDDLYTPRYNTFNPDHWNSFFATIVEAMGQDWDSGGNLVNC